MLRRLRIDNLVLIEQADLPLGRGLTALTGETGAGKTILTQAVGLLLGTKGDAAAVGPRAKEAYVEAEFDVPADFFDDDELGALAEIRPEDEPGLVLARRVFADGRTRAYAWGRAVARDDLAGATERLVAMSGQFEQRRLARPAYQLDVLDTFLGQSQAALRREARAAWRALCAARRRYDSLSRDAGAARARLAELEALVEDTEGFEPGLEDSLRATRERIGRAEELEQAVAFALEAVVPDDADGAAGLVAAAEHRLAPLAHLAPELEDAATALREAALRLRDTGSDLARYAATLDADPERVEAIEEHLDRIAGARRRYRVATFDELLARRAEALAELGAGDGATDPVESASARLAVAEGTMEKIAAQLSAARRQGVDAFARAVSTELAEVGIGDGQFVVELGARDLGPTGSDEARFMISPNPGLPFGPVAETASGGELSRVALAIAAVAGGETMIFDEIDAGVGGVTAHKVADVLERLSARAQVLVITHLPQIASRADAHWSVTKVPGHPTRTEVRRLDDDERRLELERMLGGGEFLATVAGGP